MAESNDLMDFFNPNKPFVKKILKGPDYGPVRRNPMDEPPPETDESLVCSEADWRAFIQTEERKLTEMSIESRHGASEVETVVRSDMSGIEGRSLAAKTVVANDLTDDTINLREKFNFLKDNEAAWKLPIMDKRERIMEMIDSHQIVIISGPTGCGKSTQVPQFILDKHALERKLVNIIVTQPRRIAASSLAKRVCEERKWKLGGLVGYQVGLDRAHKSEDTRLLYATTGVLKKIIIAKKNLNDYTHVILDEVHDREEDMDLVLLLCKKLLFTNSRGTKLVLMSATLNEDRLKDYFSTHIPGIGDYPAPIIKVGSQMSVSIFHFEHYTKLLVENKLNQDEFEFDLDRPGLGEKGPMLCKLIIQNLEDLEERMKKDKNKSGEPGSVLVFLPGLQEIKTVRDHLMEKDANSSDKLTWDCIPLHSSISSEEQHKIYDLPLPNHRKIILSTNIAESSLTVPDIKYVIDFCLTKNLRADRDTNYPRLMMEWACKNQLTQRAGRAGRVKHDGRVFRLIPKELESCLPIHVEPEMLRVPLTGVVLDVKMLDLGSPKQLLALAMDPPEMQSLQKTIVGLKEMGAMLTTVKGVPVRDDGDLTVLGEIVARLPLDFRLGKLIVLGHVFGLLEDSIIIAAGLNGKSIFTAPFDARVRAYKNKLNWADGTFSDCFSIFFAYTNWSLRKARGEFPDNKHGRAREMEWCKQSFLQRKALIEMKELVEEVTKNLKRLNIEPIRIQRPVTWENEQKYLVLKLIMFGAFYPNYFNKQVSSEIEINAHRTLLGKDPKTTVYLTGMDDQHSPFAAIYSGQIKKLFQDCTKDEERINLTFDGRKIYVEFDRIQCDSDRREGQGRRDENGNMTGDIIHQVYVAVKLRNIGPMNKRLRINLYGSVDHAEEKYEEWKDSVKQARERVAKSTDVEQISPPGMDVTELNIETITHVSSPSMFWVQTSEVSELDQRLNEIIQQVLRHCPAVQNASYVQVGQLYLAPFESEGYYRARINKIFQSTKDKPAQVYVFFLDYGNLAMIDITDLRVISSKVMEEFSEILTIPGLAQECRLASITPNSLRSSKGLWDDEVVDHFHQLLNGHTGGRIKSKIFSVTKSGSGHSKFVVVLDSLEVRHPDNLTVMVKKDLLDKKFADHAVESYLSQDDHRERMRFAVYTSAMKQHLVNPYKYDRAPMPPSMKEDRREQPLGLNLQGPFSPLEHKVHCVYRHGSTKLINVEPDSVNAILLDSSPSDAHDQWLVAAHVGMSPNSESLVIRNTTWLPSKPGLGALATMMFAPQVELRLNQKKSKITGFVAGLGPKTIWDKPLNQLKRSEKTHAFYPEHDIEVKLDVSISNGDVNLLNKIRYWLNQMLMKSEDGVMHLTQPKQLNEAQQGLKKNLLELLDRERRSQEKTGVQCGHEYRWNMLDQKIRLKSKLTEQEKFHYKMIDGVHIADVPNSEVILEKLIKLYTKMDEFEVNPLPYHEVCPVCPGQLMMTTPRDLHHHLNSEQHKYEESLIVDTPDTVASSSCASSGRN